MRLPLFLAALAMIPSAVIGQQGFSCSYGDQGACLGYGETVCSSGGMCVDQNAACFSSSQCNYEGFTCKSNVTECVDTYDRLLNEHNELVRNYNTLLDDHRDLIDDHNQNLIVMRRQQDSLADIETCLIYANTLAAAQSCAP